MHVCAGMTAQWYHFSMHHDACTCCWRFAPVALSTICAPWRSKVDHWVPAESRVHNKALSTVHMQRRVGMSPQDTNMSKLQKVSWTFIDYVKGEANFMDDDARSDQDKIMTGSCGLKHVSCAPAEVSTMLTRRQVTRTNDTMEEVLKRELSMWWPVNEVRWMISLVWLSKWRAPWVHMMHWRVDERPRAPPMFSPRISLDLWSLQLNISTSPLIS